MSARADSIKASGELRTVQDKEKEDEDTVKELKATISRLQSKHERELNKITRDYDEKVSIFKKKKLPRSLILLLVGSSIQRIYGLNLQCC